MGFRQSGQGEIRVVGRDRNVNKDGEQVRKVRKGKAMLGDVSRPLPQ